MMQDRQEKSWNHCKGKVCSLKPLPVGSQELHTVRSICCGDICSNVNMTTGPADLALPSWKLTVL